MRADFPETATDKESTNPVCQDERAISGAGFARVQTKISCILTRFEVKSLWSLIRFFLAFGRVRQAAKGIEGLLKTSFLVENLHTCYTLSIWKDDLAIVEFGSIREHIMAANSAFGATYREDLKRPEIWSAQFRLWAVSKHNLNWQNFDLRSLLANSWVQEKEVAHVASLGGNNHAR